MILKVILQTVWTHIRLHCFIVCKNRFEKYARIFSRRHKQTTFSDAGFLGILRVKKQLHKKQNLGKKKNGIKCLKFSYIILNNNIPSAIEKYPISSNVWTS